MVLLFPKRNELLDSSSSVKLKPSISRIERISKSKVWKTLYVSQGTQLSTIKAISNETLLADKDECKSGSNSEITDELNSKDTDKSSSTVINDELGEDSEMEEEDKNEKDFIETRLNCMTPYKLTGCNMNFPDKSLFLCELGSLNRYCSSNLTDSDLSERGITGNFEEYLIDRYIRKTTSGWDRKGMHYWLHKINMSDFRLPVVEELSRPEDAWFQLHICENCTKRLTISQKSRYTNFEFVNRCDYFHTKLLGDGETLNRNSCHCHFSNYDESLRGQLSVESGEEVDGYGLVHSQHFKRLVYSYNSCGLNFTFLDNDKKNKNKRDTENVNKTSVINPFVKVIVYGHDPCGLHFPVNLESGKSLHRNHSVNSRSSLVTNSTVKTSENCAMEDWLSSNFKLTDTNSSTAETKSQSRGSKRQIFHSSRATKPFVPINKLLKLHSKLSIKSNGSNKSQISTTEKPNNCPSKKENVAPESRDDKSKEVNTSNAMALSLHHNYYSSPETSEMNSFTSQTVIECGSSTDTCSKITSSMSQLETECSSFIDTPSKMTSSTSQPETEYDLFLGGVDPNLTTKYCAPKNFPKWKNNTPNVLMEKDKLEIHNMNVTINSKSTAVYNSKSLSDPEIDIGQSFLNSYKMTGYLTDNERDSSSESQPKTEYGSCCSKGRKMYHVCFPCDGKVLEFSVRNNKGGSLCRTHSLRLHGRTLMKKRLRAPLFLRFSNSSLMRVRMIYFGNTTNSVFVQTKKSHLRKISTTYLKNLLLLKLPKQAYFITCFLVTLIIFGVLLIQDTFPRMPRLQGPEPPPKKWYRFFK